MRLFLKLVTEIFYREHITKSGKQLMLSDSLPTNIVAGRKQNFVTIR